MGNFKESLARIREWMQETGVPEEKLGPPVTTEQEADFAQRIGFPTPEGLRALWSLASSVPFESLGCRELITPSAFTYYNDPKENFQRWLDGARDEVRTTENEEDRAELLDEMGIRLDELESEQWCELAYTTGKDLIIVSGKSGRVFWAGMDFCKLQFVANSVEEWLSECVERYCIVEWPPKKVY